MYLYIFIYTLAFITQVNLRSSIFGTKLVSEMYTAIELIQYIF